MIILRKRVFWIIIQSLGENYSEILFLDALMALCLVLESSRFLWELRVGLVGFRRLGNVAILWMSSKSLSNDSSRFCSWVRWDWALIITIPSFVIRWSFRFNSRFL